MFLAFALLCASKCLIEDRIVDWPVDKHEEIANSIPKWADYLGESANMIRVIVRQYNRVDILRVVIQPVDDRTTAWSGIYDDQTAVRKTDRRAIALPDVPKINL
jgi:hypothetical protein